MSHSSHLPVDLSIIIVSWNVWNPLRACLRSIEQSSTPSGKQSLRTFTVEGRALALETLVIDSASDDATVSLLPSQFPWVQLIASDENLGFGRASNRGYAASRGRLIYFLNPDTELTRDSLATLVAALENSPRRGAQKVGIVGPRLRYADGTWQNNRRRFPTRLSGFWESTWLGRTWPQNPWARHLHMADWPADARHDVDWLVGAAMLSRREALEAAEPQPLPPRSRGGSGWSDGFVEGLGQANLNATVVDTSHPSPARGGRAGRRREPAEREGGLPFDERFFLYSEETDLCRRVKRAGWRVVYVPEATVIHYEARSSDQVSTARHIYFNTSKVRYAERWFGQRSAALLRRYLLLEFRVQLTLERAKRRLGHKRDLRAARIAAYRAVLESELK